MILSPAVDGSCRTERILISINHTVRRNEKRAANRAFRRALKNIVHNVQIGNIDWDSEDFGNLPRYTSWDIW